MKKEVRIPKGVQNNEPIELVLSDEQIALSIFAEQDSKASVSIILKPSAESFDCTLCVTLEDHAELHLTIVQIATSKNVHIVQTSTVGKGAQFHCSNITLGGVAVDHTLNSEVVGDHGVSSIDWVFYAKNKEKQTIYATNTFSASSGGGEITLKGVAEDKAYVQCNGMINIGLQGGGTDAYLTEDVLMLDSSAKVDAIPGLEIKTNDVKASHSATVSQVSPEELFYFSARGIEEEESRKMYIEGFLGDIVRRISDVHLQEQITNAIAEKYVRV